MTADSSLNAKPVRWPLYVGIFAVLAVLVVYGFVVATTVPGGLTSPGIFGDMFGAANALFAGLGAVVLVYTIWVQSADATRSRYEQAESLRLVEEQVKFLRQDVEMQGRRDRVEAGPFFQLTSNSRGGDGLDLRLVNTGAPVIVLEFECTTPDCRIKTWYPSTLPTNEEFKAPTAIPSPHPNKFDFVMTIRDRWGEKREFDLKLDVGTPGARLDFWDRAYPGHQVIAPAGVGEKS